MRPNPPTEPPSWATAQPGSTQKMVPAFLDIRLEDVLDPNTFGIVTVGEWKRPPGTVGVALSHIRNRPAMLFGGVYVTPTPVLRTWFTELVGLAGESGFNLEFCGDMNEFLNVICTAGIPHRFFGRLDRTEAQRLAAILPTIKPVAKVGT